MHRFSFLAGALAAGVMMTRTIDAQPGGGGKFVSLGSSFAAGPGVGQSDRTSGGCGRSLSNYSHLLAARRHLKLVDVACSGATTQDVLKQGKNGLAPQIDAVDPQTRLVTVTVGGNDVDYVADLFGYSCRDSGGSCKVASDIDREQRFAALPNSMRRIVAEVHRRAPQARLVLIDYLPVVPTMGPPNCEAVPLSPPDGVRMRSVAARLARVIGAVAAETHTPIVRASSIGTGHDACSAEPYVAGYEPAVNPGWPDPVGYHPNQRGMDALAAALDDVLSPAATAP